MTRIQDLSSNEKPKERLIQFGSQALSNTELLAIIINTGSKGRSSIQVASHILAQCQSLTALRKMSLVELEKFVGIGRNKATTLLAVFELSRRLAEDKSNTYLILFILRAKLQNAIMQNLRIMIKNILFYSS